MSLPIVTVNRGHLVLSDGVLVAYHTAMSEVLAATFKDGVFKPDQRPALSDCARVRLVVETIGGDDVARREEAWAALRQLWKASQINSGGDRLTRDQMHERR